MLASDRPVLIVGFDGSEPARAALSHAARRCAGGGRVLVVCAHPLPPRDLSPAATRALGEQHEAEARSVLDALALDPPPELEQVTWGSETAGGDTARALCRVAEREDADEIVVGTHGHGRVGALLGSVAHDLLRASDRPVTAIPPHAVARMLGRPTEAGT